MSIEYKHTDGYDCLDDAMLIAFDKHNLNYNLAFIKSWCFNIDTDAKTIGEALNGNRGDRIEVLNNIFNLSFKGYSLQNEYDIYPIGNFLKLEKIGKVKIIEILKEIIQDKQKEIIIQYDTFFSPWDDLYKKYHGTHMCYVNSFDDNEVELYDSWYSTKKTISTKDCIDNAYKFIIIDFSHATEKINTAKEIIESISNSTNLDNFYKSINKFNEKLDNINLKEEFIGCSNFDYTKSPLMRNLKEVVYNKMQLSILFKEIYKIQEADEFLDISLRFEENSKKIDLLRMYIAKEFLIGTTKYSDEINNIARQIKCNDEYVIDRFNSLKI